MKRARIVIALIVLFSLIVSSNSFGWGGDGHKIIANIAEARLTPAAKAQVQALLDGAHLADVASWADEVRRDRPETSRWHYVDIPYDASSYDAARDCQATDHGDCVIAEIARAEKVLADTSRTKSDRAEALKYLVHFVGDMHQPLHSIERKDPATGNGDAGGNAVKVTFFGQPANLHAVWDSGIVTHGGVNLELVEKWLATQDEKTLAQGDPVQWALAAHDLAVRNTYVLPADLQLSDDYTKKNVPIVVEQLGSAGVRLAAILNAAFGSEPVPAEVHSYQYELIIRSGDPRFAGEISGGKGSVGPRFDVEKDKLGRILTVTSYDSGNKTRQSVFHFEADNPWPTSVDTYRGGELTSRTRIERNSRGESGRIEYLTVKGERTAFMTQEYSADHVDWTKYNTQGQPIGHGTNFFSPEGIRIRTLEYLDDKTTIEINLDSATGLELVKKTFVNGEVKITSRFTHDANGSLVREDIYNSKNELYGTTEYQEGLKVRQSYKFTSGGTAEVLISHDSKGFTTEAKFSVNERLVCTFKFDRSSDGGIKRTLAFGPGGDLYAEYPDHYVDQVRRDGSPTSQIEGTVIYKKGDWW